MARRFSGIAFVLAAVLLAGCSTTAPYVSDSLLYPRYFPSRDGALQFRVPAGWLDASADSQAHGTVVWLVRGDYAATMSVMEVRLDENARRELNRGGLLQLARLTALLADGSQGGVIEQEPGDYVINGTECCSFAVRTASRDLLRTLLLKNGSRVYSVSALKPVREGLAPAADVFDVQDAFARTLHW